MGKCKKILMSLLFIMCILMIFNCDVYAININAIYETPYTEEYQKWLNLSEEEKKKSIMPRKYEVVSSKVYNLLKSAVPVKSATAMRYDLRDTIPENVTIRNQMNTGECWAFSGIGVLESNLALKDKREGKETVVYDYSERHMDYSSANSFLNGEKNEYGYRTLGKGGWYQSAEMYLTNGRGAILEEDMPFENNENEIELSEIKGKKVQTKVEDTVYFEKSPNLDASSIEFKMWQKEIKEHIVNYGGVSTSFCSESEYDIQERGAYYCNDTTKNVDHRVTIIGWDDEYAIENFKEGCRPEHAGAWIVKNSWGDGSFSVDEWKKYMFGLYPEKFLENGWNKASDMPDSFAISQLTNNGYKFVSETGRYFKKIYKYDGYWYISYEDVLVNKYLYGIKSSNTDIDYDNLYQHDIFGCTASMSIDKSNIPGSKKSVYLANVFTKKTATLEKLNEVSIITNNTQKCKVYVNPNGTSKDKKDLLEVELENGKSEIIDPGYHTLKFKNQINITGNNFVVVVEIENISESESSVDFAEEKNEYPVYTAIVNEGESYVSYGEDFESNSWIDVGKELSANLCIKAFTTNGVQSIRIKNNPSKTEYVEGTDFEKDGMIVEAKINGEYKEINDYVIENGINLKLGQTSVIVKYENNEVSVPIVVKKKVLSKIKITKEPYKKLYIAGTNFEKAGMEVKAVYNDYIEKVLSTYIVKNGENLQIGQRYVTISYTEDGITQSVNQNIEVTEKVAGKISNIQNLSKTYNGERVSDPTYSKVGDGEVSIEWYKINKTEDVKLAESPKNVGKYRVKLIMAETDNYKGTSEEKEFEISKATYDMSGVKFDNVSYPYSGEEKQIVIRGALPQGVTVRYERNKGINAGEYDAIAIFNGDYENYNVISNMVAKLIITKIDPEYSVPSKLIAVYGQTLKDISLPDGFSWEQELTTSVGEIGENIFTVKYTPTDVINYNIITGIEVKISVKSDKSDEIILDDYDVDEEGSIVSKIIPGTDMKEFKSHIRNTNYKIINGKGEELKEEDKIGTGYKVELESGKQYTLVVYGDLNGDGKVNVVDIARLQKILTKISNSTDLINLAADLKEDSILDLKDLARLQKLATGQNIFK